MKVIQKRKKHLNRWKWYYVLQTGIAICPVCTLGVLNKVVTDAIGDHFSCHYCFAKFVSYLNERAHIHHIPIPNNTTSEEILLGKDDIYDK